MKKTLLIILSIVSIFTLAACGNNTKTYYFATTEPTPTSNWVYYVIIAKQGNEIVEATWDAYSIKGDAYSNTPFAVTATELSKYQASEQGLYNLAPGESNLKWHQQADLITNRLIETQNINERIPVPAGATITTDDFYVLAEKALASDPIAEGSYKDGFHFITNRAEGAAKAETFFYDAKNNQVLSVPAYSQYAYSIYVVVNGSIVIAYYNTVNHAYKLKIDANNKIEKYTYDHDNNPETADKTFSVIADYTTTKPSVINTKNELGLSYGMKTPNGGSDNEYYEIALTVGKYLVENQTLPQVNTEGKFDDVAGVTIRTSDFVTLLNKLATK